MNNKYAWLLIFLIFSNNVLIVTAKVNSEVHSLPRHIFIEGVAGAFMDKNFMNELIKSLVKCDFPHGKVDCHHIDVNEAVAGDKASLIPISADDIQFEGIEKLDGESAALRDMLTGAIVGAFMNSQRYIVEIGGRAVNIVVIRDTNFKSLLGNAKWLFRYDTPHGKVDYYHINVNEAVTGIKDPHIKISAATAKAAGVAGKILHFLNKIAPVLLAIKVAFDAYEIYIVYMDDLEEGTFYRTEKLLISKASVYIGVYYGAKAGASIGTTILPGVGTLIGGIVGSVVGGVVGGKVEDFVGEVVIVK